MHNGGMNTTSTATGTAPVNPCGWCQTGAHTKCVERHGDLLLDCDCTHA
jgi:hypothetical protein